MNADELLEGARAAYHAGEAARRGGSLEAGRLLHEFILAYLRPGDGMTRHERERLGVTRESAVKKAADVLRVTYRQINHLIKTAMAAELLAGGQVGDLSYNAIARFESFVRRVRGIDRSDTKGRYAADGPVSESERWELNPKFAERATALFRRAVAENFTHARAMIECIALFGEGQSKSRRLGRKSQESLDILKRTARVASPGDVAEMCLAIVQCAEDPEAVAMRLRGMLDSCKRRRRLAV